MLLLVDAGNTRIKWAVVDRSVTQPPGSWYASGSVARADAAQLSQSWSEFKIGRIVLSNVAGGGMRDELAKIVWLSLGLNAVAMEWFVSTDMLGGIHNRYINPTQLGSDRFAAVIGAHALFPSKNLIVATCGTATTIDAVDADGAFVGGMILPGLGLMASSLAKNTAQLPEVALHTNASQPFADYTDAAIVSGCLAAQAGAIERAFVAHANAHPHEEVCCILAGGAADLVAPQLSIAYRRVDNLVLIGLHTVATQTLRIC